MPENEEFTPELVPIDPAGVILGPARLKMRPKVHGRGRQHVAEAIRCPCATCAQLDRLPSALQGIPGAFRLAMPWPAFDHRWYWRQILPDRHGEPCRVVARGKMNAVLVEFEDGFRAITSRYAVRKRREAFPAPESSSADAPL